MLKNGIFAILTAMEEKITPLRFAIVNTIKDIPESDWERLFPEGPIEGYSYHKTLEESGLKEFSFSYLLARRDEQLVAIIPFFTTDFSFTTIIQGPLQKTIIRIQKVFSRFLKLKILFVGFPTCEELYIGISKEENLNEILDAALDNLYAFCRQEKIGTLLFYNLTEEQKPISKYLAAKGFARMENFSNSVIKMDVSTLDDYIAGLSRNARKNIRKKLRDSTLRAQLSTEIVDDIDGISDKIHQLYMNNFNDSKVHFETLTTDFFRNICRNMKGRAKFFITRDKDKIVAFNLIFIKGDKAIDKFIGFDEKLLFDYNLYYTTIIHNIDYCMKNGIRFYQMGITDYEPKLRLGAYLVPLYIAARFLNPALNLFSRPLVRMIEPKRFDPTLRKLKD